MKPKHLLPPVAALAIAGIGLGFQQRRITTLEEEVMLLRHSVEMAESAAEPRGDASSAAARPGAGDKDPEAIDWKDVAESLAAARSGGMPDMRAMVKIQTKLLSLDGKELSAALDEIASLELGREARDILESMLIGLLIPKEPRLVLDRYVDRLQESQGSLAWQLSHGFQQWVEKDGVEALAWLDTQIGAGKFDSKALDGSNEARLRFEAAALAALVSTDLDAIGGRIEALPENQRPELFQQGVFHRLQPGSEKDFADLVRKHVPEDERGRALASGVHGMIHRGDYGEVGAFLDQVEATPGERAEVAKQAVESKLGVLSDQGKIDRKAVDEMREWLAGQAPEEVDRVTGEALANPWGRRSNWEDRAGLIGALHAENPSDDLLVSFLSGHQAARHREAALELAAKISDETRRADVTKRLEGEAVPATE